MASLLCRAYSTKIFKKSSLPIIATVTLIFGVVLVSLQQSYSHSWIDENVSYEQDGVVVEESNSAIKALNKLATMDLRKHNNNRPAIQSKCSEKSDARGKHQKVAAFSLYGGDLNDVSTFKRYVSPLIETARNFSLTYPGWIMRIYHSYSREEAEENWKVLHENFGLASHVPDHVDLCYVKDLPELANQSYFAMTWRFLPLLDDFVDIFVSRDSDSIITQREIDAVHEWLKINRVFHVMRDHPEHCIPMLGGLWGAKVNQQRDKIQKVARKIFSLQHRHLVGFDQDLLKAFMWPLARHSLISHDSYCCDKFDCAMRRGSLMRPFPTQRPEDSLLFVGNIASKQLFNATVSFECPLQCRPADHLDWIFC